MKRLSIFCGHFGSGKTNVAVNYALELKKKGFDTVIADLDIVNPYFRTKDSEKELTDAGIRVLSIPYANTNVDLPSVPRETYTLFTDTSVHAVLDIGGDDRGAYVLGSFAPYIERNKDFDLFYVVNFYRYLTRTPQEALEVMREIELACGLRFNAIINNSNLGRETDLDVVRASEAAAEELSGLAGIPIAFTAVREDIAEGDYVPLKLQKGY